MVLIQRLNCFKTYDVRGPSNLNFEADITYQIVHAVAKKIQTKKIVVVTRLTRYATKAVVSLRYVTALQVMKCLRVISTNSSKTKVINYCAPTGW